MVQRNKIDLNSDVGESFGIYKLGLDEEVIPLISSANIACQGKRRGRRRPSWFSGPDRVWTKKYGCHPGRD